MSVIEFIMENYYIGIILILYAIISFLGKAKGNTQKQEQRRPMPPTPPSPQKSGGTLERRSEPIPVERREPEMTSTTERSPSFNEMKKQMKVLKLANEQLGMQGDPFQEYERQEQETSNQPANDPFEIKRKVASGFVSDDLRAEVIKGKIWSEVFGPPRAKNPYRARKY